MAAKPDGRNLLVCIIVCIHPWLNKLKLRNIEKPGDYIVFSLSSPKGGEGWGEEAVLISRPSPRPSPRSFLTERGRVFHRHSVFDFVRVHLCPSVAIFEFFIS
jgi:hypothetical protein